MARCACHPKRAAPWPQTALPGDTIWMGAADAQGRVVSYIQSIYWEFGSGIVLQGSGVNWQNRGCSFSLAPAHINALAPRKRPFHTLNPALARLADFVIDHHYPACRAAAQPVAALLRCGKNALEQRLSRARTRLRAELEATP